MPDCQRNTPQLAASHHTPRRNSFVNWLKTGIVSTVLLSSSFSVFATTPNLSKVLLQEDFEKDLSGWIGKSNGAHSGQIVTDPLNPSNHVLNFKNVASGGDIFKKALTNPSKKYTLSFDYLGLSKTGSKPNEFGGFVGYGVNTSGAGMWLAGTYSSYPVYHPGASFKPFTHLEDLNQWLHVTIPFQAGTDVYLTLEDWSGIAPAIPGDAYFDNILLTEEVPVAFEGVKFNDLNGNGVQDADEKGIPFETIYFTNNDLIDKGISGDYDTTTDSQGRYSITGLIPGNYTARTGLNKVPELSKTSWQTAPIRATRVGSVLPYDFIVLNGTTTQQVNFGVWDGVTRQTCTLCVVANDLQTDMGEEVSVGGSVIDKVPDGSDLTVTVESFGFSTVKVISSEERVAGATISASLSVVFPKGGAYPVKVTAKSATNQVAESTGNIIVRDVATSDACDMNVQTIWSTRSGKWDDPNVWTGGRVPQPNDWVMVRSGHEVKVAAVTSQQIKQKNVLKVKGLCVDKGAKLGNFYYRVWKTTPPGLATKYSKTVSRTRASNACDVPPTKTVRALEPPGSWDDPSTWEPAGVPSSGDAVKVPSGVSVVVPYRTTRIGVNKVDSLCNEGTIQSPTELPPDGGTYWLAINPTNLHNKGVIKANDGNGGPGVGVYLGRPTEADNDGTIQAGNGSAAQLGGGVRIEPSNFSNTGNITLGNGGRCDAWWGWCSKGGNGGELSITVVGGDLNLRGKVVGGNGGNGYHGARGGLGSKLIITPLNTENLSVECDGDTTKKTEQDVITGDGMCGKSGIAYSDPIQINLGDNTSINYGSIYFVSDDNGRIDVANLAEGAINAAKTLTWSIGKGGVIDFSKVSNKAFKAGEEMIIYADNIVLPPGKTLDQLVETPKLTVKPAKLLAMATWSNEDEKIIGEPGGSISLPLTLNNVGPATDTYDLSVTNEKDWQLCKLPPSVTVNSQRHVELDCNAILPTQAGAENLVTITATSQSDPTLQLTAKLLLRVVSEQDEQPLQDVELGVTIQDNQQSLKSNGIGVTLSESGDTALVANNLSVTVDPALITEGQLSTFNAEMKDNGDVVLTAPQGSTLEPLTVKQDGSVVLSDGKTQVTFSTEGGFVATDVENPTQQIVMTADGNVTATDSTVPDVIVTANVDGSLTGKDVVSGTEVTLTKQGEQIVTHPEFAGMQAVVNPDGTLSVTDSSDPEAAGATAIFNPQTGNYQVVNTSDGTCYDATSSQRKSFWKKVSGFVSRAAGFVAKVANKVAPVAKIIGQVAGKVNQVAGFILKNAPQVNQWANNVLQWACPCHPVIANISGFIANATAANSGFLGFLGKVQKVTKTITSVTNAVPKIASIAQKVSDWFGRWKSGRNLREGERAVSACDILRPVDEIDPYVPGSGAVTDPPAILHTLWGNLVNGSGNTFNGVTVKVGELSATPDAQGYWEIKGLPEGEHEVTAEKAGLIFMPQTVELGSQEKVEVKFTPVTDTKLKVTVNPRAPNQGDNVTYTLEILNGSEQPIAIGLSDTFPTGAGLLSLTPSEGIACAQNDATFECTADNLAAGTKATVSFEISNTLATLLTNKAILTSPQFAQPEVVTTTTKVRPYLAATCKTKPSPAIMFGNLAYDCDVQLGPHAPEPAATDVTFTLQLPKGITATQFSDTCTAANDGNVYGNVSCRLGTVTKEQAAKVVVNANLGDLLLLQLSAETKVAASNYPETKDVIRTNVLLGDAQVDGVILIDVTGSMGEELAAVIQAVEKVGINPGANIALVSFRDEVKLEILTNNRDELLKALRKLKANGGGECPEASAEALNLALDHIKPNGIILFATDAPPYPDTDVDALKAKIVDKKANFIPILTKSDCTAGDNLAK